MSAKLSDTGSVPQGRTRPGWVMVQSPAERMVPQSNRTHRVHLVLRIGASLFLNGVAAIAQPPAPPANGATAAIRIRTDFESGSAGKIEFVTPTELRLHVAGQTDSAGRNRQATWYYFRLDGVRDLNLTLHLTDLV